MALTIDEALKALPENWRFHVGHIPHWYSRDGMPSNLKRRGFEAYVLNSGYLIGTPEFIMASADAGTPADALRLAIEAGKKMAIDKSAVKAS